MATTASLPLRRTRPRATRRRWFLAGAALLVVAGVGGYLYLRSTRTAGTSPTTSTYVVGRGNLVASVAGSGSVAASRSMALSFGGGGTVTEVPVEVGDVVTAGQVLARMDDETLQLQVEIAQNNLANAQAQLDDLKAGPSAAELSAAKLGVINAELQLEQLTQGPTAADLAGARSSLITAQANLAALQAGAGPLEVQSAQDDVERAKNSLWSAQIGRDATCVQPGPQCNQANISVGNAQLAVDEAQARLDDLLAAPGDTDVQVAQLAVQQASARLAELRATATVKEIEAGQLQLENAQAQLAELTAGPTAKDLAQAEASVTSARLQLIEAQTALDEATLRAPFDGVVTAVNVMPGGPANAEGSAVSVVDRSQLHVDLKLSESDAVKVQPGQAVTLTFDSLEGRAVTGTVTYVSPVAETNNGVVTYAVRVGLRSDDEAIRVGMTANVSVVTAQKAGVLLVPNTALLPQDDGSTLVVLLSRAQGSTAGQAAPAGQPVPMGTPGAGPDGGQGFPGGVPPSGTPGARGQGRMGFPGAASNVTVEPGSATQVVVTTGLTDGTYTEILGGLDAGDVIQALATVTTGNSGFTGPGGGFGMPIIGGIFGGR